METSRLLLLIVSAACVLAAIRLVPAVGEEAAPAGAGTKPFVPPAAWEISAPLLSPEKRDTEPSFSAKDPTVVFHGGKWHVFTTVKLPNRTGMEYCCFDKWENAARSPRTLLKVSDSKYYGAPQVFYFRPHKKWYLVYQVGGMPTARKMMWVAYSTTTDIADPASWTQAKPMLDGGETDPRTQGGLDYWIICDEKNAYLFFTSLDGKMWRAWTTLEQFPLGWRECVVCLRGDIFEASHTYRLKGLDKYLTIIEANPGGRRYYKAYLADTLDGEWKALKDSEKAPFAGAANVRPVEGVAAWADNISHGELIRDGADETLTVDPADLRFVFQGATQKEKAGIGYGKIPWRLGILTPVKP